MTAGRVAARERPRRRRASTARSSGRIAVATGMARYGDYRDELEDLIGAHFPSRRAFCKANGISPAMLSHGLAGRKDLSLGALSKGLERVGYRPRFVPAAESKRKA
jgi:hypothetical protein